MSGYGEQKLTYFGESLLQGHNVFELNWGSEPSYGFFRCTPASWEVIRGDGSAVRSGPLVMTDGETVLTFVDMHLIRGALNPDNGTYDIVIADKRVLGHHTYLEQDFNTYATSRAIVGSDYEIEDSSTSSGTEWTYATMLTEMGVSGTFPRTTGFTRKPRNIRASGIQQSKAIQIAMYETNCYMLLNPFTSAVTMKKLGDLDSADTAVLTAIEEYLVKTYDVTPTALWKPTEIVAFYAKMTTGGFLTKVAAVTGGLSGKRGYITSYGDSTAGQLAAQEYASELAGEFAKAWEWKHHVYGGLHEVPPSTEAHVVRWESGPLGSFTTIKRLFPISRPPQIDSNLFAANGYVMSAGSLSTPQYQYMVYSGVAANQGGWDYVRSHTSVE